ncbi:MAG TPA: hypothetical protein VNK24_09185 [Elusimicrobiota bacterium]|nr:hypothetical protein [Elusimicrobiota bacterium]
MPVKKGIPTIFSLGLAALLSGLACRFARAADFEAGSVDAVSGLNIPVNAAETLGAASMDMSGLNTSGLNAAGINGTIPGIASETGLSQGLAAPEVPVAVKSRAAQASAPGTQAETKPESAMKAAESLVGRLGAFVKSETSGAAGKAQGVVGQVSHGRMMFDLAGKSADKSVSIGMDAQEAASQNSAISLQATAPISAGGKTVVPSNSLKALEGAWRLVSGNGPKLMELVVKGDAVQMRWPEMGYNTGYDFSNINGPAIIDKPWRGGVLAPGGLITGETTTTFKDGKLVMRNVSTETHAIRIPEQVVTTKSLEVQGDRLIQTEEMALYRRLFFYFGPYSVRTTFNTTNLDNSNFGKSSAVYERVVTEKKP